MTNLEKRILELSYKYQLSHLGSCLSAVPIIDTIYKVKDEDEKFILSAGHAHVAHLVVMEKYNQLPIDLDTGNEIELLITRYGIHCDRKAGCDVSTGSLGMGIGVAVGMAIGNRKRNTFCMISDGECTEGSVWEVLRIASEQQLDNLKIVLVYNGYGAYSEIELEPLIMRFQAFGCGVLIVDDEVDLESALEAQILKVPIVRIVKADLKEFPFLQGLDSHYKVLTTEEYEKIIR